MRTRWAGGRVERDQGQDRLVGDLAETLQPAEGDPGKVCWVMRS